MVKWDNEPTNLLNTSVPRFKARPAVSPHLFWAWWSLEREPRFTGLMSCLACFSPGFNHTYRTMANSFVQVMRPTAFPTRPIQGGVDKWKMNLRDRGRD